VSEHEKKTLVRAAALSQMTLSRFVVQSAYRQAQEVIAGQTRFFLSEEKWQEFCETLDQPAKDVPSLRRLLTEPGVFDS
jgi:uncharacterized protein (DUF1778 family)